MNNESAICHCVTWCRPYAESKPPAAHHRDCAKYKSETLYKVSANGSYCITESLDGFEDEQEYTVETVSMTRDQFENLPEFTGF